MSQYVFKINGKQYRIEIESIAGGMAQVNVNGTEYCVELGDSAPVTVSAPETKPAPEAKPAAAAKSVAEAKPAAGAGVITSPLPGVIISIDVKIGDSVARGQKVAVIEAMKMENEILSETEGKVSGIFVSKGDSVLEGAKIIEIA